MENIKQNNNFFVVGIGASAGGLEALQKFFQNLYSTENFSFIIVQHLAPNHESMLIELLSKYSSIPINLVTEHTRIKANNVYVIPPNASVVIKDHTLELMKDQQAKIQQTPIDTFLASLAEDQRENSIGIILSGMGSSGTLGLQSIKESGGLTIAQSIESAKYDSMPKYAIASGIVDLILPVEEIPESLSRFVMQMGTLQEQRSKLHKEAESHLRQICIILRNKVGHDFSQYKTKTLIRRIQRRMAIHQIDLGQDYVEYLSNHDSEKDALFADFLIGVTFFFRDPEVFKYLELEILPKIIKSKIKNENEKLRIWVVGCASGEEAYSLAILVHECILKLNARLHIQIFATDIDENAISNARRATYSGSIVEQVSPERLKKYFIKTNNSYVVAKEIREMCLFSIHDVARDPPFAYVDLLSC